MPFAKLKTSWKIRAFTGFVAGAMLLISVSADDKQAHEEFISGMKNMKKANYISAAKDFKAASLYAEDTVLKANALKEAALAYRKANKKYDEFKVLEILLKQYPTHVNFAQTVDREYKIGNEFFSGHRDILTEYIPWLGNRDKTIEIYEKALKHAPFAKPAAETKLRLGRMYLNKGEHEKAMKTFRQLIAHYQNTPAQKYAYLELAHVLIQMSKYGDGDDKYGREGRQVLQEFIKKYPKDPEVGWAKKTMLKSKDISAKKLYGVAKFYYRYGREKPAARYLTEAIREYPDSPTTNQSEELLAKIDTEYKPPKDKPEPEKRYQLYQEEPMPVEAAPIIAVPENSNGKWMLPIRDVGLGRGWKPDRGVNKSKWLRIQWE